MLAFFRSDIFEGYSRVHDKIYLERKYNPKLYDHRSSVYENRAATIAKKWDSRESLDKGFTGDINPVYREFSPSVSVQPSRATIGDFSDHK